ncbi:helix-turn-helix domain-containing protein [Salinispora arenicola]
MPSIVDPCFGAELRQLRTVAGVSLRQLASRALSSRGHLHDIEAGR